MSSVEQGLGGIWSCLYCEGTWLNALQGSEVIPQDKSPKESDTKAVLPVPSNALLCVSCESELLLATEVTGVYRCVACAGVFFEKGVLTELAPHVFSKDGEAPVVLALVAGALGTLLLADPTTLVLALQPKSSK
jgi:Zn-finger nucleic acid-binding protein